MCQSTFTLNCNNFPVARVESDSFLLVPFSLKHCYCFGILQSKAAYVLFYQRQESEHQENIEVKETGQEQVSGQDADIDMLQDGV